jgi:hypothetical protein
VNSPSTSNALKWKAKLRGHVGLLRQYRSRDVQFDWLFDEIAEIRDVYSRHTRRAITSGVEIGYGQRPYRMRALSATGVEMYGVDMEVPLLSGSLAEYVQMLRLNGRERLAKTLARRLLFDRAEERAFAKAVKSRGLIVTVQKSAFAVSDAARYMPPRSVDIVYSVNVFEHIARESLTPLVAKMPSWLNPNGLALIRPDIWTGLHGGHSLEWSGWHQDRDRERRSAPWEHLRQNRFPANTSLNELTRDDYRALFDRHFEIVEEIDPPREPVEELLTPEIRQELAGYSDADLLDAKPCFVLRPR